MTSHYGRIYLYDYPYSILCYGALQSAFAGVGLYSFVLWNLSESRHNFFEAESSRIKSWGVLVWFLTDFLMGIFLLACTLCHWRSVFFKFWIVMNWMTNIFLGYYCFSYFNLLTDSLFLNLYGWLLAMWTFLRITSTISVWYYSRLRDVLGPKVYLHLQNSSSDLNTGKATTIALDEDIETNANEELICSPFFVNKRFAVIKE